MTARKQKYVDLASRIEAAQMILSEVSRRLKNKPDLQPQAAQLASAADLLKTAQVNVRELRDTDGSDGDA